jgi:hypothetical protein
MFILTVYRSVISGKLGDAEIKTATLNHIEFIEET